MDFQKAATIFSAHLNNIGVPSNSCMPVISTVFGMMSRSHLKYHTVEHLEMMLGCADLYGIRLDCFQGTAILFHDVVYNLHSKTNEEDSIKFMEEVLRPFDISNVFMVEVSKYILATKEFLRESVDGYDEKSKQVMDLDLCSFSLMNYGMFHEIAESVRDELGTTREQTCGFYKMLASRKFIFRTDLFREHFEGIARENIRKYCEGQTS